LPLAAPWQASLEASFRSRGRHDAETLIAGAAILLLAAGRLFAEPRTLFNGRDFAGWKQYEYGIWTIENGEIVARYDRKREGRGYLFTVEEFGDFTLELEFWISKGGNSASTSDRGGGGPSR
jgi:hypothetical protein